MITIKDKNSVFNTVISYSLGFELVETIISEHDGPFRMPLEEPVNNPRPTFVGWGLCFIT